MQLKVVLLSFVSILGQKSLQILLEPSETKFYFSKIQKSVKIFHMLFFVVHISSPKFWRWKSTRKRKKYSLYSDKNITYKTCISIKFNSRKNVFLSYHYSAHCAPPLPPVLGICQGILKGEVSLYRWPPVWLVWISLFCK